MYFLYSHVHNIFQPVFDQSHFFSTENPEKEFHWTEPHVGLVTASELEDHLSLVTKGAVRTFWAPIKDMTMGPSVTRLIT